MSSCSTTPTEQNISLSEHIDVDVVIVGAGLSGLVSAYKIKIKAPSLKIVILEATDKIGGQLVCSELGEIGGKWITQEHYHIYNLCKSLGVKLNKKRQVNTFEQYFSRCWEIDKGIFSYLVNFEISRFIREFDLRSNNYRRFRFSFRSQKEETMEDYIKTKLFFEISRKFMRVIIKFICGINSEEITKKEFMSDCRRSGGLANLIKFITGTSNDIYEFSSKELLKVLLAKIKSVPIYEFSKVIEIIQYRTKYILVRDSYNTTFQCSVLVLAISWFDIAKINMQTKFPIPLPIADYENPIFITSFLIKYEQSFWRQKKSSGSVFNLNFPMIGYEIKPKIYGGIVIHNEAIIYEHLKIKILKELSECFGDRMLKPTKWICQTFEQHRILSLSGVKTYTHIIWSSTGYASSFRGLLSGAVQSGLKAAINTLFILRPQNVSWKDIAEARRANVVVTQVDSIYLFISSINLYNTIHFTMFGFSILCAYILRHRIVKFFEGCPYFRFN